MYIRKGWVVGLVKFMGGFLSALENSREGVCLPGRIGQEGFCPPGKIYGRAIVCLAKFDEMGILSGRAFVLHSNRHVWHHSMI